MIKININHQYGIKDFIDQYLVWVDNRDFYQASKRSILELNDDGWMCFHHSDVNAINECESPVIIVDQTTEGINSFDNFIQYRPDRRYLFLSNGWWDPRCHRLPYRYELVNYLYILFDLAHTYLTPFKFNFYLDKDYDFDCEKSSIFVSTIGKHKNDRSYLVEQLTSTLSYSNYILKYNGKNYGSIDHSDIVKFSKDKFDDYIQVLDKYQHTVSQTLPIELYNQAYFNLVVETNIDLENEFHLTEKIGKALITGIPFVVVSSAGFLGHLRQLGFTTYDALWDESYDHEPLWTARIEKIIALCETLKGFDWLANQEKLKMIAMKNREVFFKLDKIANRTFESFENALIALDQ